MTALREPGSPLPELIARYRAADQAWKEALGVYVHAEDEADKLAPKRPSELPWPLPAREDLGRLDERDRGFRSVNADGRSRTEVYDRWQAQIAAIYKGMNVPELEAASAAAGQVQREAFAAVVATAPATVIEARDKLEVLLHEHDDGMADGVLNEAVPFRVFLKDIEQLAASSVAVEAVSLRPEPLEPLTVT